MSLFKSKKQAEISVDDLVSVSGAVSLLHDCFAKTNATQTAQNQRIGLAIRNGYGIGSNDLLKSAR